MPSEQPAVTERDRLDALAVLTDAAADRAGIPLRCWSPCPLGPKGMSRHAFAVAINPTSLGNDPRAIKQRGTGGYDGDADERLAEPRHDGVEKPTFAEFERALATELAERGLDDAVTLGRRFEPAGNSRRWIITVRGWSGVDADRIRALEAANAE